MTFGLGHEPPLLRLAERLDPTPHPDVADPVGWARRKLAVYLWSKQQEIAASVVANRYTAVPSCFDSGKSFEAAVLTAWWLDVHPPGSAFVVTTAPTDPQVKAILWREIHRLWQDHGLSGRVTMDAQWKINDRLVAYGRKPEDNNPAAFQGIHARYVLVIIDEAAGVAGPLWDAVDGLATNEYARVLAIGNPEDPASQFAKVCRPGSGWKVITISAFDTPNFTDEWVPEDVRPLLVSRTWVEERKTRLGIGSPKWTSKVTGAFPDVSDDTLIAPSLVLAAQKRIILPSAPTTLGVDVARYGKDETVLMLRRGQRYRLLQRFSKQSTMQSAGHVKKALFDLALAIGGGTRINTYIDVNGLGGGVVDRLLEQNVEVMGVNPGQSPVDKERFVNARAEWYWNVRDMFEQGQIDIDEADDDLANQLQTLKWTVDSKGRIKIESKADLAKRGMPSPDEADALSMAAIESLSTMTTEDLLAMHRASPGVAGRDLLDANF